MASLDEQTVCGGWENGCVTAKEVIALSQASENNERDESVWGYWGRCDRDKERGRGIAAVGGKKVRLSSLCLLK